MADCTTSLQYAKAPIAKKRCFYSIRCLLLNKEGSPTTTTKEKKVQLPMHQQRNPQPGLIRPIKQAEPDQSGVDAVLGNNKFQIPAQ
ncbi:MAG: hypothetical protein NWE93_09500 [Candidatus Bathyarchaeota archaeon]|nr:hypothetical protein [Candidatus Bathyarchaeota archaeon]